MKHVTRRVRAAVPLVVLALCATATPASARPLPPPPVRVERYISASVTVTYLPGLGTWVAPGGDAAWAFDCVTTDDGRGTVDVTCTKDAGDGYVLTCSKIDVNGLGGTVATEPHPHATGWCSDNDQTWVETMPPPGTVKPYRSFRHLSTERLGCATAGTPAVAYTVTCAFSAVARQPIVGGVVMTGTLPAGFTWTTWGVLAGPDWECVALTTLVPTVRCMTRQDTTQWYCNQTYAMADGSASLVPLRVRAQTTCDTKVAGGPPAAPAPVAGRGTWGPNVVSTEEVPTLSGVPVDTYMDWLNHDANVFFCQAFGPLGTPAVHPWTVECWEP